MADIEDTERKEIMQCVFECLVVIVITIRIMIGAIELHFP